MIKGENSNPMLENGKESCNCKKKSCKRHGKCEECIAYHANHIKRPLPYCNRDNAMPSIIAREKKNN